MTGDDSLVHVSNEGSRVRHGRTETTFRRFVSTLDNPGVPVGADLTSADAAFDAIVRQHGGSEFRPVNP